MLSSELSLEVGESDDVDGREDPMPRFRVLVMRVIISWLEHPISLYSRDPLLATPNWLGDDWGKRTLISLWDGTRS